MNFPSLQLSQNMALMKVPFFHVAPPHDQVTPFLVRYMAPANDPKVPNNDGGKLA